MIYFTVNFKLKYNEYGGLNTEEKHYFDVGDFRIKLEKVFEEFDENELKKYDNGIYILSICKYIVDRVPEIDSINYESRGMIDTYYKQEILEDYNKIKNNIGVSNFKDIIDIKKSENI